MKKRKRVMSVRNAQGIKVKQCCASCSHKFYDEDGHRCCDLLQMKVAQKDGCKEWQMREALQQMGRRPGRVKRKDYLKFVLKVRLEEIELLEQGRITLKECKTVEALRKEFGNEIYAIR